MYSTWSIARRQTVDATLREEYFREAVVGGLSKVPCTHKSPGDEREA